MDITEVDKFVAQAKTDKEFWIKINSLVSYIMNTSVALMGDVKYKYLAPDKLQEDAIKEILNELGFDYVVSIMDTISGFEFNTMISFVQYISQLKGTRKGMELVLKLMGFDSIIKEWWEDPLDLREPWSYEIIVIVDSSHVPDIFNTLDKVRIFSENYVLAKISNIDVRFASDRFAERYPVLAGFTHSTYKGIIIQRV